MNEARERAVREVLADLALLAVAEKENIKVDELELDNELVKLAEQMKIQVSTAREALEYLLSQVEIVDPEGHRLDISLFEEDESDQESETFEINASKEEAKTSTDGNLDIDALESVDTDSTSGGM